MGTERRYVVTLSEEDREYLKKLIQKEKGSGFRTRHAQILLKLDEIPENKGWTGEKIARAYSSNPVSVSHIARRFVEEGLESALSRMEELYRIAVCDDEPVFLSAHEKMTDEILTEANIPHQITAFSSAGALREALSDHSAVFDILLLDILMESESGIELAKHLREGGNDVSILFITCSPDFSLEGYSVYPVHYLLKPLQKERLAEVLFRDYKRNRAPKSVIFPIKGGSRGMALDSILYIEILNREVTVHTTDRQFAISCPTLMSASALVPGDTFLQCHKSFLANMKNIIDVTKSAVLLTNGESLPVGRAFYREALTRFVDFMVKK